MKTITVVLFGCIAMWGNCLRIGPEQLPPKSKFQSNLHGTSFKRFVLDAYRNGDLALQRQLRPNPGPINRKMNAFPAIEKEPNDPTLVISLTTVPEMLTASNLNVMKKVLDSLKNQTIPADAVEMNLPTRSGGLFSGGSGEYPQLHNTPLPEGITVYETDDWLALTNIVPTVQRAKVRPRETLVIVVDDDKVYSPYLVEDHLRAYRAKPSSASTCRGYKLPRQGELPYDWDEIGFSFYGHTLGSPERVAAVTGSDSWSIPASLFTDGLWKDLLQPVDTEKTEAEAEPEVVKRACSLMNDIWVSGQMSKHQISKYTIPCRQECWDAGAVKRHGVFDLRFSLTRHDLNDLCFKKFVNSWSDEELFVDPWAEKARVRN